MLSTAPKVKNNCKLQFWSNIFERKYMRRVIAAHNAIVQFKHSLAHYFQSKQNIATVRNNFLFGFRCD